MQRRITLALVSLLLLPSILSACGPQSDSGAAQAIRLYQVLPVARANSTLVETDGEGEAIALINAGTQKYTVSGWSIATGSGKVTLPHLTMEPGQVVYLANDAEYFKRYWNKTPDFEFGADSDKAVPDLKVEGSNPPVLDDDGDVITVLDDKGNTVDILAFGSVANIPAPWTGPTVALVDSYPVTPANQVITRRKQGDVLMLEPQAESWSGGTPRQPERIYFAGQSHLPVRKVSGPMTLTALSAPENAAPELFRLIEQSRKSIRLAGFRFSSTELAERLAEAARRGVRVQVGLERQPGGWEPSSAEKESVRILEAGGVELLLYHDWDGANSTAFTAMGSTFAILDGETVLISSGDWTGSISTAGTACAERSWLAVIRGGPEAANLFREVWDADFTPGSPAIRGYDKDLDLPLWPVSGQPAACSPYTPVKPHPLTVTGNVTLTRILSPDNTLDREQGFLGLLRSAREELLISADAIHKWWGSAGDPANLEHHPQPYLTELVAAARRGVAVKVLLDGRDADGDDLRGNRPVAEYLNGLAQAEGLNLEARLVSGEQTGIGPLQQHNALIVDDAVVIAAPAGTESAFRQERRLALKLEGLPAFTGYYRDLFIHDWNTASAGVAAR